MAPWTLLCFPFTLALVFFQSMKSQTLTAGAGLQVWLTCPILYSVVLRKSHSEGTELLCFSKSLAFLFLCLITHILLTNKPLLVKAIWQMWSIITATAGSTSIRGFAIHLPWELLYSTTGGDIYFCKLSLKELLKTWQLWDHFYDKILNHCQHKGEWFRLSIWSLITCTKIWGSESQRQANKTLNLKN